MSTDRSFTLYPAVDVRQGAVVRLLRGDYDQETRYPGDPVEVATHYARSGARWLHLVDLDAARGGGYTLTDTLTGESFDLRAKAVVNAAGVWAGEVDPSITLRPSRGTHLVFDAAAFGNPTASLTVPIPGETNRFIFVMPEQLGRVYLGLTDEDSPGPIPDVPEPTEPEIDFLLDTINTALETAVTRADITGSYAGLRPLIDNGAGRTSDLSRDHAVLNSPTGVISVVGGKLTEYRHMAEDTVDKAVSWRGLSAGPCTTRNLPLVGAAGPTGDAPASLVDRFGGESAGVLAHATCSDPLAPLVEGLDVTRAEVEFSIAHEGALDADDILDRRTRIGLVEADRARALLAAESFFA